MRRATPFSVQLLSTFVGLLIGMAGVLTAAAYSSSQVTLEDEARRNVDLATRTREQTVTQLFTLRQQRSEGFLASIESLCTEPLGSGRLAWVDDCVQTMVDDFRTSERALGTLLTYGRRRIRRSGRPVSAGAPPAGALARVMVRDNGAVEYVMRTSLGSIALAMQFDHDEVADLFRDQSGLGRRGEAFLVDYQGRFLSPVSHEPPLIPADRAAAFLEDCRAGADAFVDIDYRGIKAIQSFRPLTVLGTACVAARIGYDEALVPAERLRDALIVRAGWFVLIGAVLSLVAAQWISAPVRRLAASARELQTGRFDRPIPLAGPSEVRALGLAFNAMANDLAELVAKEQAARREAEAANHAKDEFLARVSHELRTPLTAILGWAQMIRSGRLPAARAQHGIEVIERSARAQRQLIEDLLDVSRIGSDRMRIAREPVRLADVVDSALDAVRPQAAAKQVEVETELSEQAVVLGDPRRLEQIVWNLAWNAVKFTQPSGHVRIKLARAGRQVVLSVADTGVGISSAFLPYVFEWFRQADPKSRSQSGLGLGLGIVRHLVQLHGGSVRAESLGEGKGATFTVTLPVHEAPVAVQPASQPAKPVAVHSVARRLDAVRVLVVEDDEATRELVRTTLEDAGASVETVATAGDARREVLADSPDVLISDIRMPEEDGYSLIRSLRGAGVATPAIALTAYARREDADEAHAAGFQVHLPKPVDAGRLIDAVATLIQGRTIH
jgi:signal transduction histidine kinase/ActR/RegA family two-component response regulator